MLYRFMAIFLILCGFAFGYDDVGCLVGGSSASNSHPGFFALGGVAGITAAQAHNGNGESFFEDTGLAVADDGGSIEITAALDGDFADLLVGMGVYVTWTDTGGGGTGTDGPQIIIAIDTGTNPDTITIGGWLAIYAGDDVGIVVGGAVEIVDGLQEVLDNTTIGSAAAQNVFVYMTGNATITADIAKDVGGGSASTMWHLYGCDETYTRVTPTRTSIGTGKANGPLDTTDMPTITLNSGVEFGVPVNYVHIDGIYFTGSSTDTYGMVGTSTGDYQIYSNCVFLNAGNGAGSRAISTDKYGRIYNCDAFATGANEITRCFQTGTSVSVINCRGTNTSTSATSSVFAVAYGAIQNCLAYDGAGIGVYLYNSNGFSSTITGCTFENLLTAIKFFTTSTAFPTLVANNVVMNCTNFIDNPGASNILIAGFYNQLNTITTSYPADVVGELGFQDLTSDPLFVSAANDDYNLQAASPAKNSGPFLTNRGAMSDAEAAGGGIFPQKIERRGD